MREHLARGLSRDSLTFLPRVDPADRFFDEMYSTDVALDTIAYGGQTTTLDTLAMAIPAISLPVDAVVARCVAGAVQSGEGKQASNI